MFKELKGFEIYFTHAANAYTATTYPIQPNIGHMLWYYNLSTLSHVLVYLGVGQNDICGFVYLCYEELQIHINQIIAKILLEFELYTYMCQGM